MKNYRNLYGTPMSIYMDPDDGAGAGGNGDGGGSEGNDKPPKGGEKDPTFDDLMGNKAYKSEFDRRVNAAIETAVKNAKEKWDTIASEKASEAEKLEKMTKAEQAEYQAHKREEALNRREAEIIRKELQAQAKLTLAEKHIPQGLAAILNYESAETCDASIKSVEDAFQAAVEDAVNDRLKGGKPPKKAGDGDYTMEDQVAAALGMSTAHK